MRKRTAGARAGSVAWGSGDEACFDISEWGKGCWGWLPRSVCYPGLFAECGGSWLRLWGEQKNLLSSCLEGLKGKFGVLDDEAAGVK